MKKIVSLLVLLCCVLHLSAAIRGQLRKNIVYKSVGDSTLTLDIYSNPADAGRVVPTIIYIHGGSWVSGNKGWITAYPDRSAVANALLDNHYRVVSIDYRLADGIRRNFLEELEDCRDAIRWVKQHAAEYGIDANNIGLWGTSAGAHLAMVCAYQPVDGTDVKLVINNYGPTDLNSLFKTSLPGIAQDAVRLVKPQLMRSRDLMLRVFPDNFPDLYSPVDLAKRHSVPTAILHGKKDEVVPVSQAYQLATVLVEKGEDYVLCIYPKDKHAFPTMSGSDIEDDVRQTISFCKKHFGK